MKTADDAWERSGWRERRWVIAEYHPGQKTGGGIGDLPFASSPALRPMIALLSVVAVTRLTVRDASRDEETASRPATQCVDSRYVAILSAWRYKEHRPGMTGREFYMALARLGGHQNRTRTNHRVGSPCGAAGWRCSKCCRGQSCSA